MQSFTTLSFTTLNGSIPTAAGWLGIKWDALGSTFLFTAVAGIVFVLLFALGGRFMALSGGSLHHHDGGLSSSSGLSSSAGTERSAVSPVENPGSRVLAWLCFTGCAAVVVYGIYLIIPFFHQS